MKNAQKQDSVLPNLFFDSRASSYWWRLESGEFLPLDTGQVKLHLRNSGCDPDTWVEGLNQVERALLNAQRDRHLHYAGPLAGWPTGPFQTDDGRRVLVTSAPRLPVPKAGNFDTLERFTAQLLGPEQSVHFGLWLAAGLRAQARQDFRPGQFTAFAGPSGCGKSLLQHLITATFGGRCASPYLYMVGETTFNADLAQAEHWSIEDRASSTDVRTRRKFGASVKEAVVNRDLAVHAKGRQAITLPTFRRVTASMNDEHENLMLMPPMDESIVDKVNLYHCAYAKVGSDRRKTWATFTGELPAFLHACLALKVPPKWKDDRYGVKAFHAPALLEVLTSASQETRLLTLIDEAIFRDQNMGVWTGSAPQLESLLLKSEFGHTTAKLLYYTSACSVYLARLAQKSPERVSVSRKGGKAVWTIVAP